MCWEAVGERCWILSLRTFNFSCCESHRQKQDSLVWDKKKDKTEEEAIVVHRSPDDTCKPPQRFLILLCFLGMLGAFHWTHLATWVGGNCCGLVAVETRWEHVLCVRSGDDIIHSMTLTAANSSEMREEEMRRLRAQKPLLGKESFCFQMVLHRLKGSCDIYQWFLITNA